MAQRFSAQLGLFAFGVAVCAGLYAGNTVVTVLTRALVAMFVGVVVGRVLGGVIAAVVDEQRRPVAPDEAESDRHPSGPEDNPATRPEAG